MSGKPALKVIVCKGPSCSLFGAAELQRWCEELKRAGLSVEHQISGCTGNCLESPVVQWNDQYVTRATPEGLTGRMIEDNCLV